MELRLAKMEEVEELFPFYQEIFDSPYTTWSEKYPTLDMLKRDCELKSLYVLTDGDEIIGSTVLIPENELEDLELGQLKDGTQREIGRLLIKTKYQGKGYVGEMVKRVEALLKEQKAGALQFLVAKRNIPALKAYEKLGYKNMGTAFLYEGRYFLFEKLL